MDNIMIVLSIIFVLLVIVVFSCVSFLIKRVSKIGVNNADVTKNLPVEMQDQSTIFDTHMDYQDQINKFIRLEFLFELKKWISNTKSTQSVSNGEPLFYTQLMDDEFLQKKLSRLTSLIMSKMSKDLKNAFYRLYSKSFKYYDDNGDALLLYIARALELYIERIITDLSILQEHLAVREPAVKASEVVSQFNIEINNELYILTDTFVMNFRPNENETQSKL